MRRGHVHINQSLWCALKQIDSRRLTENNPPTTNWQFNSSPFHRRPLPLLRIQSPPHSFLRRSFRPPLPLFRCGYRIGQLLPPCVPRLSILRHPLSLRLETSHSRRSCLKGLTPLNEHSMWVRSQILVSKFQYFSVHVSLH